MLRITLAMYPPGSEMAGATFATAAMLLFLAATVLHVFTSRRGTTAPALC
jgi:hypothetical protein